MKDVIKLVCGFSILAIFVGCQSEGITQRDISQSPILKLEPVELAPKKDCFGEKKDFSIEFFKTNNSGEVII